MNELASVYRVECRKLLAQPRVRWILLFLLVVPWVYIGLILHQDRLPLETLYGRYLKDTGYATPLAILVYASQWVLPLIAALIAGDVFSSEDQQGTLKTILTRSVGRNAVFWGKLAAAFTFTALAVVTVAASATLAGIVAVGNAPLIDVGGTVRQPGVAAGLVAASWATVLLPTLGFAAIAMMVSILTRSSVLGVIVPVVLGLCMQLYTFLNAWDTVRHVLLGYTMSAWRGLLDSPSYAAPLEHALPVAAVYLVTAIAIGFVAFRRRDVAGG
ncbi:MAG: ABC transporter permease [Thermoleophilia bacterium]|nr:ABC transporter permease [Thermoleophilia bacterium]